MVRSFAGIDTETAVASKNNYWWGLMCCSVWAKSNLCNLATWLRSLRSLRKRPHGSFGRFAPFAAMQSVTWNEECECLPGRAGKPERSEGWTGQDEPSQSGQAKTHQDEPKHEPSARLSGEQWSSP